MFRQVYTTPECLCENRRALTYLVLELRGLYIEPRKLSILSLLVQDEPREVAQPSRLSQREAKTKQGR